MRYGADSLKRFCFMRQKNYNNLTIGGMDKITCNLQANRWAN